jgi:[ribosomal protein S5]-alanine N-acetyltransferase
MSVSSRDRVETPRLICERLRAEHAAELSSLLRDPRVARTLFPSGQPPSESDVIKNVDAKVMHWDRYGFGQWLLRERTTGAMVGRGGLQYTFVAGCNEVEVGWAIIPERWGQGLATELAMVAVEVAFDDVGLGELVAFTLPGNIASRRVMEKAGFAYERAIVHVGLPHVLYRRTAGSVRRRGQDSR